MACALEGSGLRVGLVEASLPNSPAPGFDERKLALAAASLNALGALGVLAEMTAPPSPIRRIHVSRAGDFGAVRLSAAELGREAFGGVVSARELGSALERRLSRLQDTQLLRPCTLIAIKIADDAVTVQLEGLGGTSSARARLLVAADGTRSFARTALGIAAEEFDYRQSLVVCSVGTDRPADGTAYERFTGDGPVALLPIAGDYGSVCAVGSDEAASVMALDDRHYMDYFQRRFGWRAGRIERIGRRSAYPIARVLAERVATQRAVLVGNAAQTIHPIGAQGFNLGLRDALSLAELMEGDDPGSPALLAAYVESRREDREGTLAFSDGLVRSTTNAGASMRVLRSLGLLALGHLPGLSEPLVSGAMGFRGRVPRLARGTR